MDKRLFGKFYTITNPFDSNVFCKWFESIPGIEDKVILEPFAGKNNIVSMINKIGYDNGWKCFDICSCEEDNSFPVFPVDQRDTISDFPQGYDLVITNPPYLARNSATRRGMGFPETEHDDVYKLCLELMLRNCRHVAAIIPESFITQGLYHDRLEIAISLTCKMFDDTDCPVCLALFGDDSSDDFIIYKQERKIGKYSKLKKFLLDDTGNSGIWKFNDPSGSIGIRCIDGTIRDSIEFVRGSSLPSESIKSTSRSSTRVSGLPRGICIEDFLILCNQKLADYRANTKDVFLTPFKGLRKDFKYRRRLDYKTARTIMSNALFEIGGGKECQE